MDLGYPFTRACLLGDGCIGWHREEFPFISITHSAKQEDYLRYKASRLSKELGREVKVNGPHEYKDSRTGNIYKRFNVHVSHKTALSGLYRILYPDHKKLITSEFLEGLGAEALALLWMDDGGMNTSTNAGLLHLYCTMGEAEVYTEWITKISQGKIQPRLYREGETYRLRIMARQVPELERLIGRFLLPSMAYKLRLTYSSNSMTAARREMLGPPILTQAENSRLESLSDKALTEFMTSKGFNYTKKGSKSERIKRIREESLISG